MKTIEIINVFPRRHVPRQKLLSLAQLILKNEMKSNNHFQITFIFVSDLAIKKINFRFLNHNYPTDVIAFTLSENNSDAVDGEIYVNLEQAARQARDYDVSFTNEVLRLAAHGLLHILGYDDQTKKDRESMLSLGEYYLRKSS